MTHDTKLTLLERLVREQRTFDATNKTPRTDKIDAEIDETDCAEAYAYLLAFARQLELELRALSAPAVPDGWKLVPMEPTPAMLEAFYACARHQDIWRAMLEAAPQLSQDKRSL